MVTYNEQQLNAHMKGFEIPHVIRTCVRALFTEVKDVSTATLFKVLPTVRQALDYLSMSTGLTDKQRRVISKLYLVFTGDRSIIHEQLQKDVDAINTPESRGALGHAMAFACHGIDSFIPRLHCRKSQIQPIHLELISKRLKQKSNFDASKWKEQIHMAKQIATEFNRARAGRYTDPTVLRKVFPYFDDCEFTHTIQDSQSSQVGFVNADQVPGMKLRLFASPYRYLQCAMRPFQRVLKQALASIPEDWYLDQDAGAEFVQQMLRKGAVAYCYDLSSATHLFPYTAQEAVLRKLDAPQWCLELLKYASKGVYKGFGCEFQWKSGQPLGTGPSFFAFSLCHHAIVRGIFRRLGFDPTNGYAMVGDDIVIFNTSVAKVYAKVMSRIGCKINHDKTMISSRAAEFVGYSIGHTYKFRTGKFRPVTQGNILSYNRIWTQAQPEFKDAAAYFAGTLDPAISKFVECELRLRTVKKVRKFKIQDIEHFVRMVRLELSHTFSMRKGYKYTNFALKRLVGFFQEEVTKCPQCYPELTEMFLNPSRIEGITLVRVATEIILSHIIGHRAQPVWYQRFLVWFDYPEDGTQYTHAKLLRQLTQQLRMASASNSTLLFSEASFAKVIKKSITKARRLQSEGELEVNVYNLVADLGSWVKQTA
jgi:hypothetical protein